MARKTLKQKLRANNRVLKKLVDTEHKLAGLTINFETQKMQAVAMAHGVMATLLDVKNKLDNESDEFKTIEKAAQGHIAQCCAQLLQMGIPMDEVNEAIGRGH